MLKTRKLVHGVGVNDADYPVNTYAVINGRHKRLWRCPIYRSWRDMLNRCYSAKWHDQFPTYTGCTVDPEWHSFMAFRAWMLSQDWEGKQLDKDILFPGNKVYGPDSCVFVSSQLNSFMIDCCAARGKWPIGVCWAERAGKFIALCRNPFTGKRGHLGYFTDPFEAHEAWRAKKHEYACRYADMQTDPRIAEALKSRYLKGATP